MTESRALLDLLTPAQRLELLGLARKGQMTFQRFWNSRLGCGCAIGSILAIQKGLVGTVEDESYVVSNVEQGEVRVAISGSYFLSDMENYFYEIEKNGVCFDQTEEECDDMLDRQRQAACDEFAVEVQLMIDGHGEFTWDGVS